MTKSSPILTKRTFDHGLWKIEIHIKTQFQQKHELFFINLCSSISNYLYFTQLSGRKWDSIQHQSMNSFTIIIIRIWIRGYFQFIFRQWKCSFLTILLHPDEIRTILCYILANYMIGFNVLMFFERMKVKSGEWRMGFGRVFLGLHRRNAQISIKRHYSLHKTTNYCSELNIEC